MSLKAYDGLKTDSGFFYLQQKIKENIDKFREASENKIAETYADIILDLVDDKQSIETKLVFQTKTKDDELLISKIEKKDTTILSYLFQVGKILSKSYFVNDFCAHLNLYLEAKNDRILIYPGILVSEHKKILDTFLDDWYAQNQTDKDESIPEDVWEERCRDWWDFNETKGLNIVVKLFDPFNFRDNIVENFRGDELIKKILSHIPSDEKRINKILKRKFIDIKMQKFLKEIEQEDKSSSTTRVYFKALDYLKTEEGKCEFEDYKKTEPIHIKKIDEDFLLNEKIN